MTNQIPTLDERLRDARAEAVADGDAAMEVRLGALIAVFEGAHRLFLLDPDRCQSLMEEAVKAAREGIGDFELLAFERALDRHPDNKPLPIVILRRSLHKTEDPRRGR